MTECIEDEHGNQLGFVSESWRGKEILFLKDTNGKKIFSILGEKNLNPNKELFEIYQINDSNNKTISKIFFKYEKIPPHKKRFLKKYSWKSSFFL